MFISRATPKQAPITAASKTILNGWNLSGFRLVEPTARRGRALSAPLWLLAALCDGCHSALFGLRLVEPTPRRDCGDLHFGDFQNFHPHLHILCTDGCFYDDDAFTVCPPPNTGDLEELFRHEVFKMLKAEGKINDVVI